MNAGCLTHLIKLVRYLPALPEQSRHTGLQDDYLLLKYNQLFHLSFISLDRNNLASAHLLHCIVTTGGAPDGFADTFFTILKFN